MPLDPIAAWFWSVGVNPEAVVFAVVFASLVTAGIKLAQMAATK